MGACLSGAAGSGGGGGGGGGHQQPPNALRNPVAYAAGLAGAVVHGGVAYAQSEHGGGAHKPPRQHQSESQHQHHGGAAQGMQPPKKAAERVIRRAFVERVPDGDTMTVRFGSKPETARVRVFAIDSPETKQNFGPDAGRIGRDLILNTHVTLHVQTTDQYGRLVAEVVMEDGRDFGREMLRRGAAWHYTAYDSRQELEGLQREAQLARRGLWAFDRPQPPWEYRKRQRRA
jgi:micrococcal nuclease